MNESGEVKSEDAVGLKEDRIYPVEKGITVGQSELSVDAVVAQVRKVREICTKVMKEDYHFGVIPGCGNKPTLLKPGAEVLLMAFRLAPKVDVREIDLGNGHREYVTKISLYHIITGLFCGEGEGCCSTIETKYHFRTQNTGALVPREYWDSGNDEKTRDKSILGGSQFSPRKKDDKWFIFERIEHDNPADYYNTCLKMSFKRALVGVSLTATAASDVFTQDIEEAPELYGGEAKKETPQEKSTKDSNPPKDPTSCTTAQRKKLYARNHDTFKMDDDLFLNVICELINRDIDGLDKLTKEEASHCISDFENTDYIAQVRNNITKKESENQSEQEDLPF